MGEVIKLDFTTNVHASTEETYRLIHAFVQIPDRSLRAKVVDMTLALLEGCAPANSDPRDGNTLGVLSSPSLNRQGTDEGA